MTTCFTDLPVQQPPNAKQPPDGKSEVEKPSESRESGLKPGGEPA